MGKIALSLAVSAFLLAPAPSFPQQYPSVPFVAVAFPSQKESTFWTALFTASEKEIFVYNRRSLQIYERFSIDEGLEEVLGEAFRQLKETPHVDVRTGLKERLEDGLGLASAYWPHLSRIFKGADIPESLLYLTLAESLFNPRASSVKAAMGVWQFIPGTARDYGLRVDENVDERLDPLKSTRAAARYLRNLYGVFRDLPLSVLAFNQGEARVKEYVAQARMAHPRKAQLSYHDVKPFIPSEYFVAHNFLEIFVAVSALAKNPSSYSLKVKPRPVLRFEETHIARSASLEELARRFKTSVMELKRLNPDLKQTTLRVGKRPFLLKVPPQKP